MVLRGMAVKPAFVMLYLTDIINTIADANLSVQKLTESKASQP